jgi:hypothetical protein
MSFGSAPSYTPTAPPPLATPATMANPNVSNAGAQASQRAAAAAQAASMNMTGAQGVSGEKLAPATLLGGTK